MNNKQKTAFWFCLILFVASVLFAPWEIRYPISFYGGKAQYLVERDYSPIFISPASLKVVNGGDLSRGETSIQISQLVLEWFCLIVIYGGLHIAFRRPNSTA